MLDKWYRNLPRDQWDERKQVVSRSKFILDIAREIVYNMSIETQKTSESDYDSPSWSHKQAHLNGKQEAYREIMAILTIKEI